MRLVNTATLALEEFPEKSVPSYCILSHTWEEDEISYAEMLEKSPVTRSKRGYAKVKDFATWAAERRIQYVWVDTCCIRHDSSSELSEAINSMYRWYQNALRCYVYLGDVYGFPPMPNDVKERRLWEAQLYRALQRCRWITRGWTLQELIAPPEVMFLSRDWTLLFRKKDWNAQLSMLLGIGREVLLTCNPGTASIAQRMSWASHRITTRPEDRAYCLLGIFDVSMPMLYGEGGEKAFIRLQEEIMKSSDDHSLFAWRNKEQQHASCYGLLAASPIQFSDSGTIISVDSFEDDAPYSVTNKGLSLSLRLLPYAMELNDRDIYIGMLSCRYPDPKGNPVGIYLKKLGLNQYARIDAHRIHVGLEEYDKTEGRTARDLGILTHLYVRQDTRLPFGYNTRMVSGFLINEIFSAPDVYLCNASPNISWGSQQGFAEIRQEDLGRRAIICYGNRASPGTLVIVLSWDRTSQKYGATSFYDNFWSSNPDSLAKLESSGTPEYVGAPNVEVDFKVAGRIHKANVDMQMGMKDRVVVIQVTITIERALTSDALETQRTFASLPGSTQAKYPRPQSKSW